MKKFGFGKKDAGEDESGKRPMFKSRSKTSSSNPYAQGVAANDPYAQAKADIGLAPPIQHNGGLQPPNSGSGLPSRPASGRASSSIASGGGSGVGYGDTKFGNQAGYGEGKFGNSSYGSEKPADSSSNYNAGGYGNLGPSLNDDSASIDPRRDELFGGARERMQQGPNGYGQPPPYSTGPGANAGVNNAYGAYGDRQLTAEEEEQEDIDVAKQEIKTMKQQDVSSTRNALQAAAQAEETGRSTLERLGAQGERMHNTNKNLDLAANHQRVAEDKAKELKIANRSMFRMHVDNPFTKSGRERRDQEILDKHREDREQREATRHEAYESGQRMQNKFKMLAEARSDGPKSKSTLAERAKYQFEADSDDDKMEDEIENNLDELTGATTRLGLLAKAQGDVIQEQNHLLKELGTKVGFCWLFNQGCRLLTIL